MQTPSDILGDNGPLAQHVPGFAPRQAQQAMAEAILEAMTYGTMLIAEAGTGTGKTYAYLVPALMSGRRVLISTGTKNLQDQLFHRDVPTVRKALNLPVQVCLLKGRANYLCKHRLAQAEADVMHWAPAFGEKVRTIRTWATQTRRGDIAELTAISDTDPIWYQVTSTIDNCLGQECASFDDCHLVTARRDAQAADIVVVNHHLLMADLALKEEGFGDLLPSADCYVIDEAHQLPEVASNFFGIALSSNQLIELAQDAVQAFHSEANDDPQFALCADALEKAARDWRLAFGQEQRRDAWTKVARIPAVQASLREVRDQLGCLTSMLGLLAERGKELGNCARRATTLVTRFGVLCDEVPAAHIQWYETHRRSVSLHLTPLEIGSYFQQCVQAQPGSWIFTSATLAVAGHFEHFMQRLGISEAETACWDSPFDYANQALCYLPGIKTEPNDPEYNQKVIGVAREVIETSKGRAFVLFTSYRALTEAATALQDSLGYPVLVQGQAPRDALLARFRELGNAVLLGTSSFWEGVDVRGDALSCVIIDKLPFASPGDPVLQARIEAMRKAGENAFMEFQLPQAVITLKQGVGRLIRDPHDRGVLVLCDPRLQTKAYGKVFLQSLPPFRLSYQLDDVVQFFADTDCEVA